MEDAIIIEPMKLVLWFLKATETRKCITGLESQQEAPAPQKGIYEAVKLKIGLQRTPQVGDAIKTEFLHSKREELANKEAKLYVLLAIKQERWGYLSPLDHR